ncbi:hypothetical protein KC357_g202 [Hortaea werneckii]|nr:hypothetical protein KC357_g202 [Hortaea werneckii]
MSAARTFSSLAIALSASLGMIFSPLDNTTTSSTLPRYAHIDGLDGSGTLNVSVDPRHWSTFVCCQMASPASRGSGPPPKATLDHSDNLGNTFSSAATSARRDGGIIAADAQPILSICSTVSIEGEVEASRMEWRQGRVHRTTRPFPCCGMSAIHVRKKLLRIDSSYKAVCDFDWLRKTS